MLLRKILELVYAIFQDMKPNELAMPTENVKKCASMACKPAYKSFKQHG